MRNYYKKILAASYVLVCMLFFELNVFTQAGTESFNGHYYNNLDYTDYVFSRTDNNIDFNWGNGSPDSRIAPDTFSVRWEGNFTFEQGEYDFSVTVDDGVRLYIDNELIIDKWLIQPPTTYTVRRSMTSGNHYVKMEYFENDGGAVAKLYWSKYILPQAGTESFYGYYYDNSDFTNQVLVRTEEEINFNWGNGSPDPGIEPDYFSVLWLGNFSFEDGDYEFKATVDDGVRLYIDQELVIDKWFTQSPTTYTVNKRMTAGSHLVRMEYYEETGGATAKLSWLKLLTATLPFKKGEHPRIIITNDDIPSIAAKVDEPSDPLYSAYMAMKNFVDSAISNNWTWSYIQGPSSEAAREKTVTAAFVYVIENYLHPGTGSFYINGIKQVLENNDPDLFTGYTRGLRSFAVAYDWIYNGLTPQERIALGNKLLTSYAVEQDPNNRGAGEWPLDVWHVMFSNMPSGEWTYAAIALWNETDLNGNADNSIAQTKLNQIKTFLVGKKIPFSNMAGGGINPDGGYDHIGGTRQFALELYAWDKATGEDLWSTSRYLTENIKTRLFALRMHADRWVMFGVFTDWGSDKAFTDDYPVEILSKKDNSGIAQYVANDIFEDKTQKPWKEDGDQYRWIIFYDPEKPATNYNTLPKSYYAQGYNANGTSPVNGLDAGWVFFRSGWTKDDTLIGFTSGDWFTAKQVYNVNAFCIYRGGDLATMNNNNQLTGGDFNYSFQMNYGKPTVAVNSITVSDPNFAMDQGQELMQNDYINPNVTNPYYYDPSTNSYLFVNEAWNPVYLDHVKGAKAIDRGDIIKFETTDYYDYVIGDGSNAYHPERLTKFHRVLAFLEKKYLLVLDRVTATKPEYVKRWYLHTVKEPVIPGTQLTDTSSVDGSTTWSQADFNNLYVDSDPAGGRLFVKSLLPDWATYRKRGGEGFFFWRNDRSWNPEPGSAADQTGTGFEGRKGWRLEQDVSGQAYNMFLNVLYPTDSTVSSMPETVRISQADGNLTTDKMVGAHIKDGAENMLVLLSSDPDGAAVTSNFEVTVEATTEKVKGFVFDTDPAVKYDIIRSGSTTAQTFIITPGSGILSAGIEVLEHTEKGTLVFTAEIPPLNRRYCSVDALR